MTARQLQVVAWSISAAAAVVAVVAWGQGNGWQIAGLSTYQIFPLFGLLAFSLMWSHFMAAVLRVIFKLDRTVLAGYFEVTSLVVLASILLHPGLLAWQLWRDGQGLPPGSALKYAARGYNIYVLLGMISLLVFLAFEFRRKFGQKPWWKFVAAASDAAMFLILLHSLKLGSQLQSGWLRDVWYFYGTSLAAALVYLYIRKLKRCQSDSI